MTERTVNSKSLAPDEAATSQVLELAWIERQVTTFSECLYQPEDISETRCIAPRDVQDRLTHECLLHPEKATPDQKKAARKLAQKKHGPFVIKNWCRASELPDMVPYLYELNTHPILRYGIYCGPNPRNEGGLSGDANVKRCRALFVDVDDIEPGDGCGRWEFLHHRIDAINLPMPTMMVFSGHGIHAYWRLTEAIEVLSWKTVQTSLIEALQADKACKNAERVMRLPGFANTKKEPHIDCFIITTEGERCQ